MKTSFYYLRLLPLLAIPVVLLLSCQKTNNTSTPVSSDTQLKTQYMNATNDIYESGNLDNEDFDDIMGYNLSSSKNFSSCKTVTNDPSKNVYPHTTTVDYGSGCTNSNGVTKKGKRITTYYVDPATAAPGALLSKMDYDNYYVNNTHIEGEVQTYSLSGGGAATSVIQTITVRKTSKGGDVKTYYADQTSTQIAGNGTADPNDDVFSTTGNSIGLELLNGANILGFRTDIDYKNPVIYSVACGYKVQGAVDATIHVFVPQPQDLYEVLDYGNGSCDNDATLTVNGGTPQTVTLPLQFWPLH